jgi:hypothetical protein
VVTSEEAEEMAKRLGIKFYRACVKENLNVSEGRAPLIALNTPLLLQV